MLPNGLFCMIITNIAWCKAMVSFSKALLCSGNCVNVVQYLNYLFFKVQICKGLQKKKTVFEISAHD